MSYLLFLQSIREACPIAITEALRVFAEFTVDSTVCIVFALVYWCIDVHCGALMMANYASSYMLNQVVKVLLCIERPFVRDTRIHPYDKALKSATGYSFPSGHATLNTAVYATIALCYRKSKRILALCAIAVVLACFSRNFVGVHTIEDVAAGFALTMLVVLANAYIFRLMDRYKNVELGYLAFNILVCIAVLLALPNMQNAVGIQLGFYLGYFIQRRFVHYKIQGSYLYRLLLFIPGIIIVLLLYRKLLPLAFNPLGKLYRRVLVPFTTFFVITALWPWVIKSVFARIGTRVKGLYS